MSGVLLSVAFYAVLRFKVIADAALGPAFLRTLLLILALATLAVAAAVLLIGQRDYKRMLAYSSMEHMGLIALGAAIGSRLAIAAVLLHMAGHGLAKTVAFLSAGHILHQRRHEPDRRGARPGHPDARCWPGLFGLAVLALLGFPPAACSPASWASPGPVPPPGLGWADRRRRSRSCCSPSPRSACAPAGCCSAPRRGPPARPPSRRPPAEPPHRR